MGLWYKWGWPGWPYYYGFCPPSVVGLFDQYPIGTLLAVGQDSGFWYGTFGGIQDGVAVLTQAQLFSNIGSPIDGIRPIVRIPLNQVTFVSL